MVRTGIQSKLARAREAEEVLAKQMDIDASKRMTLSGA